MSGYWRSFIVNQPYTYTVTNADGTQTEQQAVRQVEHREWVETPDVYVPPEPPQTFNSYDEAGQRFDLEDSILVSEDFFQWNDDGDGIVQDNEIGAALPIDDVLGGDLDEARVEQAIAAAAAQAVSIPADATEAEAQALIDQAEQLAIDNYHAYRETYSVRDAAVLARTDIISAQALAGETNFSENDYLIMYEAAEILTGVPSEVLRAMGVGESGSGLYEDGRPRHFSILGEMYPANATGLACTNLTPGQGGAKIFTDGENFILSTSHAQDLELVEQGYQVYPVVIGNDLKDLDGDGDLDLASVGIGIHQLTLGPDTINEGLATGTPVVLQGGDNVWPGLDIDVERAIRDPAYNILMAGRLLQWARPWAGFSDGLVPPQGQSAPEFYLANPGSPTPEDWGYIVGEAQGTVADSVSQQNVVNAMNDPYSVPGWSEAEPNLYDARPDPLDHTDNEDACTNR